MKTNDNLMYFRMLLEMISVLKYMKSSTSEYIFGHGWAIWNDKNRMKMATS